MSQADRNPVVEAENHSIVDADHYRTLLRQKAELYGFHLSDIQTDRLIRYYEPGSLNLMKWLKSILLTA